MGARSAGGTGSTLMDEAAPTAKKQTLKRLAAELRPYSKPLIGGVLLMLLATPAGLIPNLMWMVVVDHVIVDRQIQWLVPALAVSIGVLVFVPLICCFFIARHFNAAMKARYAASREALGGVGARLHESLGGFLLVKAFARGEQEEQQFREQVGKHFSRTRSPFRRRRTPSSSGMSRSATTKSDRSSRT